MHRIDTATAEDGKFVNGNAAQGKKGTQVDETWLNSVQEEICNVIEDNGQTLDSSNNGQLSNVLSRNCIDGKIASTFTLSTTMANVSSAFSIVLNPGKILDITLMTTLEANTSSDSAYLQMALYSSSRQIGTLKECALGSAYYSQKSFRFTYKNTTSAAITVSFYAKTTVNASAQLDGVYVTGCIL